MMTFELPPVAPAPGPESPVSPASLYSPPRPRLWLHVVLFVITAFTTTVSGAFQAGVDLLAEPHRLPEGLPFAFSLLAILAAHELGHYLVSRRHRLRVSLPYFIPGLPFPPPLPGTFGALIRIRSPILDRRTLMEVGCSGPLCGVLVIIPVLVVGLLLSPVVVLPPHGVQGVQLGEPLLFRLLCWLTLGPLGPDEHVLLHPVGFAGWLGLLITALNLLPVGQLDGGHIMYALFPGAHRHISFATLGVLFLFGIFSWQGWLLWVTVLLVLGLRHPPPAYDWIPLDRRRKLLGWVTLGIFLLTFTPAPFTLN